MLDYLIELLASFCAVVVVLTLHEFAHAYVAYHCGDPTPKWSGRLSLDPLRHFDPVGLICFTLVGFGWARPVAINPSNFRRYRLGLGLTASAGIVMNYLAAFLVYPLFLVVLFYMPDVPFITDFLYDLTYFLFAYNLSFFVFNLLPLNPLDGFRIWEAVDRKKGKVYQFFYKYGQIILLALIAESFICNLFVRFGVVQMMNFNILNWFMTFATDYLGWPITALWGLIPW